MPERDLNQLIGRATTDSKFKDRLLDPKTRLDAINDFQDGKEEGVVRQPGEEPQKGNLTPKEIKSLMDISATDLATFANGAQDIIESGKRKR